RGPRRCGPHRAAGPSQGFRAALVPSPESEPMRQGVVALVCALLPGLSAAQPSIEARRFALVIGVNDGGPSRLRLRYAASDAKEIARVLEQLGGVADDDMTLLLEADRAKILSRVEQLGRRLAEARAAVRRVEVVFYYSGHSDEDGFLVPAEPISYSPLPPPPHSLPS